MVLTPYSGEVLLTVKTVRNYRITEIEYLEYTENHIAALLYLAAEGWLELARGDLKLDNDINEFVESI